MTGSSESRPSLESATIPLMTVERGQRRGPGPRRWVPAEPLLAAELRRMALHLETAAVLDLKAQRATDPAQIAVLHRRAEQRRREAAAIRAMLSARGLVLRSSASLP